MIPLVHLSQFYPVLKEMSDDINQEIYSAASDGRYDEVAGSISHADPGWTSAGGNSALHNAAWYGSVQVVGLLLDHGWDT